jgi:hypothetical protein
MPSVRGVGGDARDGGGAGISRICGGCGEDGGAPNASSAHLLILALSVSMMQAGSVMVLIESLLSVTDTV